MASSSSACFTIQVLSGKFCGAVDSAQGLVRGSQILYFFAASSAQRCLEIFSFLSSKYYCLREDGEY